MRENYEYTLIKKLEKRDKKTKGNGFLKAIFAPYYFFAETYCKVKIWNKFIYNKMITEDDIFNFLDKQDFEIRPRKRFLKMDTIEGSRYDFNDLKQSKEMIFKDYSEAFLQILRKNIPFDVENFMNLHVEINDKVVTSYGEIYHSLVYYVWVQYWRETRFVESRTRFFKWVSFVCIVSFVVLMLRYFSVI